jgi:hypothetical protein
VIFSALSSSPGTFDFTTDVKLIDTSTGIQIGEDITLHGLGSGYFSADGLRAVYAAGNYVGGPGMYISSVAVIDTTTGAQIGDTINLDGVAGVDVNPDGTRALVRQFDYNDPANVTTTFMDLDLDQTIADAV